MRDRKLGGAAVLILCTAVYWMTAFPSIDWWDSAEYSTAAATMGVVSPPGSLILTLLGWPVVHLLPGGSPAHRLNLFAGVLAAMTAALTYAVVAELADAAGERRERAGVAGGAAAALAFAFSPLAWEYAVAFTPYILTVVFTALILWTMVRWWRDADRDDSWRWLALTALLFGLDFSVHRTNALLMPALLPWILLRRPSTLRSLRAIGAMAGALVLGLSVQLLVMPMARMTESPINWDAPTNLRSFWDYISLSTRGGGFLLGVLPRKAPFWSVQVGDVLHMLRDNVLGWQLPIAVAFVVGIVALFRRSWKLGSAVVTTIFIQLALTIVYFNIPENFFRSLHRHYLPLLVTIAVVAGFGLQHVITSGGAARGDVLFALIAVAMPAAELAHNWRDADQSNNHFAEDYARNALALLPRDAVHFTVGDNDTFPLFYMQYAEGFRGDVDVVNYSVAALPRFADQLRRRVPGFPITMTEHERRMAPMQQSSNKTIEVPVHGSAKDLDLPPGVAAPSSVIMHPSSLGSGEFRTLGDFTMADIIRTNEFRRPITISTTAGNLGWLQGFARQDGFYWRILPTAGPGPSIARLRTLITEASYRGYADSSVAIRGPSRNIGFLYLDAFNALARAERDSAECRIDVARTRALIPPARLQATPSAICR
jgi:hypothetical protein